MKNGYIREWDPGRKRMIGQHRLIMERSIGRELASWEHVHHKNGVKTDNRLENLEIWKRKHPFGVREADYHCPGCRCLEAKVVMT